MLEAFLILVVLGFAFAVYQQKKAHRLERMEQSKRIESIKSDALRERDQLLDALSDAFLLVNDNSQIIFANKMAQDLLQGRQLVGRTIMEVFLDDQVSSVIMKCIRKGKPKQERVTLTSAYTPLGSAGEQGFSSWIVDAAPLHRNGGDKLTRIVIRDVTAEHQADQVRRDFVANASHELRTPMAIINGYLENLLEDDVVDDPVMARKFLTTMDKHGKRVSMLVEDMLVISKMESGDAMSLNKQLFSIKDCIQDVCDRLESVIAKQSAKVEVEVMPPNLEILGDRFYWVQILFNLIENALKQNPNIPLRVKVRVEEKAKKIRISICDNGVGIPSVDLPHIFRRFYRVEKHHSQTAIKGTGLGLSIVKRAIEAHGGKIEATSTPGEETCFVIKLPRG